MNENNNRNTKGGKFVQLTDESGGSFELLHYDGLILPGHFFKFAEPKNVFNAVKEFKHKKDDILICAYPKSGNHWFLNLVNHMVSAKTVEDTHSINVNLMEAYPLNKLEASTSPRVLISHLPVSHLPVDHFKKCGKVILLLRNPKDIAVSYWYHLTKDRHLGCTLSWSGFLKHFMEGNILFGSYFEYLRKWQRYIQTEKYRNILCIYYEDLKEQPLKELQKVQHFLGLDNCIQRLNQIITKCSLANMKSDVDSGKLRTRLLDKDKRPFIFRKGEVGDWMNHFTVSQNIYCDQLISQQMKDSIFNFRYVLDPGNIPKHRL